MDRSTINIGVALALAVLVAVPASAQTPSASTDPGLMVARMANGQLKGWLKKAADQMSEADYAFKPTAEVRSFGQVIAHVADQDYLFCSAAKGEKPPVRDLEKTATTKADIVKAQADAFAYCDAVCAAMTDATTRTAVQLMGRQMPAIAALLFRTHHASLHYGNVVTYMRLRGKVPPSSG